MIAATHMAVGNPMHLLIGETETESFGEDLGRRAAAGDVICLCGPLGAGKTRLVAGIARGLRCDALVTSPTFAIVHEYRGGRLPLFHFDFYRFESAQELWAIGWEEYLDRPGVAVVEWADRFPEVIPGNATWWNLEYESEDSRRILPVVSSPKR
jgi:tRNA threonylcarbamoyladenosine biosynthesis protein TsaE